MTRFLLIVLAAFAFAMIFVETARADTLVLRADGIVVTLVDTPCPNKELAGAITSSGLKGAKQAFVVNAQGGLSACWASMDAEDIYIIDEFGYYGTLPKAAFKRVPGA